MKMSDVKLDVQYVRLTQKLSTTKDIYVHVHVYRGYLPPSFNVVRSMHALVRKAANALANPAISKAS